MRFATGHYDEMNLKLFGRHYEEDSLVATNEAFRAGDSNRIGGP